MILSALIFGHTKAQTVDLLEYHSESLSKYFLVTEGDTQRVAGFAFETKLLEATRIANDTVLLVLEYKGGTDMVIQVKMKGKANWVEFKAFCFSKYPQTQFNYYSQSPKSIAEISNDSSVVSYSKVNKYQYEFRHAGDKFTVDWRKPDSDISIFLDKTSTKATVAHPKRGLIGWFKKNRYFRC